jgi:hypothetical protein
VTECTTQLCRDETSRGVAGHESREQLGGESRRRLGVAWISDANQRRAFGEVAHRSQVAAQRVEERTVHQNDCRPRCVQRRGSGKGGNAANLEIVP